VRRYAWLLASVVLAAGCRRGDVNARWRPDPAPTPSASPAAVAAPRADGRLPAGVHPTRYHLELSVDPSQPTFAGRVRIGVEIERPTRSIVLHARGPRILTAAVSTRAGKQWAKAVGRKAAHSKGADEELVLSVENELGVGTAELDLEYEAPYGSNLSGLYRVERGGRHYAFTQFEPTDARRAFPCFDEPGFKVPVDLSVTVPEGMIAVANMPELRRRANPAARLETFEFQTTPPLPSYLVAFAVGPFHVEDGARDPVPIRLVSLPGNEKLGSLALEAARAELALLSSYFGERYPYPKLDIVAVPEFGAGAMENPGLVTFREELLLLDEKTASLDARRSLAGILAHELAHMWFGDLVTPAWWDDIWLNEAFATWMGGKIANQWKPGYRIPLERVAAKQWVMGLDSLASARRIRQPVHSSSEALESFDGITYVKGASVLGMAERWLGPEAFRTGVRNHIARHRHGNARAADLFAALGEASGKDVARMMSTFVDRPGVPLVSLESRCDKSRGGAAQQVLTISQSQYRPLGSSATVSGEPWVLPLCVRGAAEAEATCLLMDTPTTNVTLSAKACSPLVLPNADEVGYYRYSLSKDALAAITAKDLARLSPEERVGLVGNAWALVESGDLEPVAYLGLVDRFGAEDQHVVWDQIVTSLRKLSRFLVTDAVRPELEKRVVRLLGPPARKLGWKNQPGDSDETKLLRKTLLAGLAELGRDAWARDESQRLANAWLADPKSVSADLAEVALAAAARDGDSALFDRIVARAQHADVPEVRVMAVTALAAFERPELVKRTLDFALDGTLKPAELRYVFPPLFERPATAGVTLDWLKAHFAELEKSLPTFVVGRFPWVAAGLCDRKRVAEAGDFFGGRLAHIEGADKHLAQAVEAGNLCAALRDRQGPAAVHALGGSS